MRRYRAAIGALALVVLLVTSAAAAPASNLNVAVQHTSASDFNAGTFTNTSVEGSGDNASVVLEREGAGSGISPDYAINGSLADYAGNTANFQDSPFGFGENSSIQGGPITNNDNIVSRTDVTFSQGDTLVWREYHNTSAISGLVFAAQNTNGAGSWSGYHAQIADGSLQIREYTSGSSAKLAENTGVTVPQDEWLRGEITWQGDGTITFELFDEAGNSIGQVSTTDTSYTSGGVGVRIFDGLVHFNTDERFGPAANSGQYVSQNVSATNVQEVAFNVTAENATINTTVQYWDAGWHYANSATITTSGNYTVPISDGSYSIWRTKVLFENSSAGETSAELHDETFLFSARIPAAENASATPQSGSKLTTKAANLSIPVSDPDFGTPQGDNVTVEFFVDGVSVATETISSNQTVWHKETITEGGSHTWHVELTDEYADTGPVSSQTFSMQTPGTLRIYNESSPTELLDSATAELRFYFQNSTTGTADLIVNRTTNNGTINMTGLPANQPFVVVVDAEGYIPRRVYVPSLYEQQSIYLLPESAPNVETIFALQDFTGNWPEEATVLLVQRALNNSWQTVQADYFGATGEWPAQLRFNARHRLILLNTNTGDERNLGTFTPLTSGESTLVITAEGPDVDPNKPIISLSPSTRQLAASSSPGLTISVSENTVPLAWWNASIVYRNATSTQTLATINRSGPSGGSVIPSIDLSGLDGGNVTVVVDVTAESGATFSKTAVFELTAVYSQQFGLLSVLDFGLGQLPSQSVGTFTTLFSLLIVAVGMAAVGKSSAVVSSEVVGLIGVGLLASTTLLGWVGYEVLFAAGVAWVAFAALRRGIV